MRTQKGKRREEYNICSIVNIIYIYGDSKVGNVYRNYGIGV